MLSDCGQNVAMQQEGPFECVGWRKPGGKTQNPGRYLATGAFSNRENRRVRSISADIDGAQAIAERRKYLARHIAAVVAAEADEADAEAMAEVLMMKATEAATPSTAPRLRGSGCGSQRHGAERSCGNQCKSEFT